MKMRPLAFLSSLYFSCILLLLGGFFSPVAVVLARMKYDNSFIRNIANQTINDGFYPCANLSFTATGRVNVQKMIYDCSDNIPSPGSPPSVVAHANGFHPTNVSIGIAINNLMAIDDITSVVKVDFWLRAYWKDPRWFLPPEVWDYLHPHVKEGGLDIVEYVNNQNELTFWLPDIYFYQGIDVQYTRELIRIFPDGSIFWARHAVASMMESQMSLKDFPLDTQQVWLTFESFSYDQKFVRLQLMEIDMTNPIGFNPVPDTDILFVSLNKLWEYAGKSSNCNTPDFVPVFFDPTRTFSACHFVLYFQRRSSGVVTRLAFPISIFLIIVGISFWAHIDKRIEITVEVVLIVSALYIVIGQVIPFTGYLTMMDKFLISVFILLTVTIFLHVVTLQLDYKTAKYPMFAFCRDTVVFCCRVFWIPISLFVFLFNFDLLHGPYYDFYIALCVGFSMYGFVRSRSLYNTFVIALHNLRQKLTISQEFTENSAIQLTMFERFLLRSLDVTEHIVRDGLRRGSVSAMELNESEDTGSPRSSSRSSPRDLNAEAVDEADERSTIRSRSTDGGVRRRRRRGGGGGGGGGNPNNNDNDNRYVAVDEDENHSISTASSAASGIRVRTYGQARDGSRDHGEGEDTAVIDMPAAAVAAASDTDTTSTSGTDRHRRHAARRGSKGSTATTPSNAAVLDQLENEASNIRFGETSDTNSPRPQRSSVTHGRKAPQHFFTAGTSSRNLTTTTAGRPVQSQITSASTTAQQIQQPQEQQQQPDEFTFAKPESGQRRIVKSESEWGRSYRNIVQNDPGVRVKTVINKKHEHHRQQQAPQSQHRSHHQHQHHHSHNGTASSGHSQRNLGRGGSSRRILEHPEDREEEEEEEEEEEGHQSQEETPRVNSYASKFARQAPKPSKQPSRREVSSMAAASAGAPSSLPPPPLTTALPVFPHGNGTLPQHNGSGNNSSSTSTSNNTGNTGMKFATLAGQLMAARRDDGVMAAAENGDPSSSPYVGNSNSTDVNQVAPPPPPPPTPQSPFPDNAPAAGGGRSPAAITQIPREQL